MMMMIMDDDDDYDDWERLEKSERMQVLYGNERSGYIQQINRNTLALSLDNNAKEKKN